MGKHEIGALGTIPMLDSADRLARFWDQDWNLVGHVFADLPPDGSESTILRIPVPAGSVIQERLVGKLSKGARFYVTIPRRRFVWSVVGIQATGDRWAMQWSVTALSHDEWMRSHIRSGSKYIAWLRSGHQDGGAA